MRAPDNNAGQRDVVPTGITIIIYYVHSCTVPYTHTHTVALHVRGLHGRAAMSQV